MCVCLYVYVYHVWLCRVNHDLALLLRLRDQKHGRQRRMKRFMNTATIPFCILPLKNIL